MNRHYFQEGVETTFQEIWEYVKKNGCVDPKEILDIFGQKKTKFMFDYMVGNVIGFDENEKLIELKGHDENQLFAFGRHDMYTNRGEKLR